MSEALAIPCSAALFLAHKEPLLLLDELTHLDTKSAQCTARTDAESLFAIDGFFEPVVAVEWMAQTVGVFVGAAKILDKKAPRIGFIIGCPQVTFHVEQIAVNTPVVVKVQPIWVEENSGSFDCAVHHQTTGALLAEGRLTAHEPNL